MVKGEKRRRADRIPRDIVRAVAAAEDKKAADIVLLDLRKAAAFADYFLICSGTSARQIRTIADAVVETLAARGSKPSHVEGYDQSEWVLIDYFDFIVHIFSPESRLFYGLERLWGNAERVKIPSASRVDSRQSTVVSQSSVVNQSSVVSRRSTVRRPPGAD
jgi:ribosome-associated protein